LARRVKALFNESLAALLTPLRRRELLLVCSQPSGAKREELQRRLTFAVDAARRANDISIRVVTSVGLFDILRAEAITIGDQALAPRWALRLMRNVFDIDYERNPIDGWALAELTDFLLPPAARAERVGARAALCARVSALRSEASRGVYVIGTGPSLARAIDQDFSVGVVVVCNTIVRDRSLWRHLEPDFLVAGDAIYHFGHTPHARAFRADARARLAESGGRTLFVYPEIFDAVVRREFVGLEGVLIPVPFGEHTDVMVDLCEHFALPRLGNVLNLLLLPLGSTLGRHLRLWGFDGRSPTDTGFWANSSKQAYLELIPTIREAHPAFFETLVPAGRESEYVRAVHGDALDEQLQDAERGGYTIEMLHFSWTPVFRKRFSGPDPESTA
jgi:hypothetical protein